MLETSSGLRCDDRGEPGDRIEASDVVCKQQNGDRFEEKSLDIIEFALGSTEPKVSLRNFKERTADKRESQADMRAMTDLRQRDLNLAFDSDSRLVRTSLIRHGSFKGPSLEDLLKDSRKKMFGIERLRQEESILDKYRPVKIQQSKIDQYSTFGGALDECLCLAKRRDGPSTVDCKMPTTDQTDENRLLGKTSTRLKEGLSALGKDEEPLSLIMSKSVKKLSKIELEKTNEAIRERYTPRKFAKESAAKEAVEAIDTLEDLLKTSKKKIVGFERESEAVPLAEGKQSCTEKMTENMSHWSVHGSLALLDERVLRFDEELLVEKEVYVTLEHKFDKVFQHRSKAVCFGCQQPLFNPLNQEKSKSLPCGKKFHLVDSTNKTCLQKYFERHGSALTCAKCRAYLSKISATPLNN